VQQHGVELPPFLRELAIGPAAGAVDVGGPSREAEAGEDRASRAAMASAALMMWLSCL
jgi:hypothetical protein